MTLFQMKLLTPGGRHAALEGLQTKWPRKEYRPRNSTAESSATCTSTTEEEYEEKSPTLSDWTFGLTIIE